MPLKWGTQGRSTGGRTRITPSFGIVADSGGEDDYYPYVLKNVRYILLTLNARI